MFKWIKKIFKKPKPKKIDYDSELSTIELKLNSYINSNRYDLWRVNKEITNVRSKVNGIIKPEYQSYDRKYRQYYKSIVNFNHEIRANPYSEASKTLRRTRSRLWGLIARNSLEYESYLRNLIATTRFEINAPFERTKFIKLPKTG